MSYFPLSVLETTTYAEKPRPLNNDLLTPTDSIAKTKNRSFQRFASLAVLGPSSLLEPS